MRIPKNGMLFMIIVIIMMTGIMIIANTNYQYRATLILMFIYIIIYPHLQYDNTSQKMSCQIEQIKCLPTWTACE